MSRYQPVPSSSSPRNSSARRPSFSSISSFRFSGPSRQNSQIPDPDEMDAAFDGPDDEDDEGGERRGLLSSQRQEGVSRGMPGGYDFERDYVS